MSSIVIEDDDCQLFMNKRYLLGTIEILKNDIVMVSYMWLVC